MRIRNIAVLFLSFILFVFFNSSTIQTVQAQENQKEKPNVYDETADAKLEIATALAEAKKENKRVLIQWGANWCGWCVKLHGLFKEDKKIARKLLYEYEVVYVDMGKLEKNVDIAEKYKAHEKIKSSGNPYLTVLDGDGNVLANQETSSLEKDKQHDPVKVLGFLDKHTPTYLSAEDILQKNLKLAKKTDKNIFLQFGAPW